MKKSFGNDLQVCFANQEFVVQICSKKCYFPYKIASFLKGNSNFYYKFGQQIPCTRSTLVKHKYYKISISDDRPNLTPEKYSSFPSKIFFTWFDPLAWKGWKTILKVEELWDLDYENR